MLPARHRLRDSTTFRSTVRRGRRGGGPLVVVHLREPDSAGSPDPLGPPRAGLVVARSVGSAVVRNLVKRRLRHLLRDRMASLPDGTVVVVRALPAAAGASFAELSAELDRVLSRCTRRDRT